MTSNQQEKIIKTITFELVANKDLKKLTCKQCVFDSCVPTNATYFDDAGILDCKSGYWRIKK